MDNRGGSEQAWIGTAGAAGLAPQEPKISTNVYISWVYVGVQEFMWGEVGAKDRGWHGRLAQYVWGHTTSGMGAWNPPCTKFPRPIWTWAYSRKLNS